MKGKTLWALFLLVLLPAIVLGQPPAVVYQGPSRSLELTGSEWPDVVMITRLGGGCQPCERFILNDLKPLVNSGKSVLVAPSSVGIVPRFRFISKDGRVTEHVGYITHTELLGRLR